MLDIKRRNKMKKYFSGGVCFLLLILMAPQVFGETITFGDNTLFWAGWPSQSTNDSLRTALNTSLDALGTPDILGGSATINNSGYLTNVTFNVKNTRDINTWNLLKPADLFIDTNDDKIWDYVVNMITPSYNVGDKGLYAINQPLTAPGYIMSSIPGHTVRDNHPIGVPVTGTPIEYVNSIGWPGSLPTGDTTVVSFDFGAQTIFVESKFFNIGWTVNCANDVIYEHLDPVPEPGTLLLLSLGIIGLAVMQRKRFFAKQIG
jgi:hypothetical protein